MVYAISPSIAAWLARQMTAASGLQLKLQRSRAAQCGQRAGRQARGRSCCGGRPRPSCTRLIGAAFEILHAAAHTTQFAPGRVSTRCLPPLIPPAHDGTTAARTVAVVTAPSENPRGRGGMGDDIVGMRGCRTCVYLHAPWMWRMWRGCPKQAMRKTPRRRTH